MEEKRRSKRLKEENEVTITVISGAKNPPKKKVIYNYSKDISSSGARIHASILLPVDTLVKIDFALKKIQQQITAMGKVKWVKIIIDDASYEAGVEFVNTPREAIKKIEEYIDWREKCFGFKKI
jgi:hypothetical protein